VKFLVVKLHALGDMVIITPAIRRLRQAFPGAQIDLLTTEWSAPAIFGNPFIDSSVVVPDALFFSPDLATILPTAKLIWKLRRQAYDGAVVFHRNRRIEFFIKLTGIAPRFRFADATGRFTQYLDENRHSALTACELADRAITGLNGAAQNPAELETMHYDWFVSEGERAEAGRLLAGLGMEAGQFAALFPGGAVNPRIADEVRRWSAAGFAEVAKQLRNEFGLKVILLGSKTDVGVCAELERLSDSSAIEMCGRISVRVAAAVTERAAVAISNDSGPLHIAAAVGTPTVGIFGPTGVRLKLPPGKHCRAASFGLPCSPCYFTLFKGCIFPTIRCMEELTAERVMKVVGKLLEGRREMGAFL